MWLLPTRVAVYQIIIIYLHSPSFTYFPLKRRVKRQEMVNQRRLGLILIRAEHAISSASLLFQAHRLRLHFSHPTVPSPVTTSRLDHHTRQNLTLPSKKHPLLPADSYPSCVSPVASSAQLESANQGRSFSDDCTPSVFARLCLLILHFFPSPPLRSVIPSTVADHGGALITPRQPFHPSGPDERPSLRHQLRRRRGWARGSRHLQDMPRGGR